jgi:hypothetical protein
VIYRQGWKVEQIRFIEGDHFSNEQDLRKNLKLFQVPEANIESIGSKLIMRLFHEYTIILKYICSTRFNGDSTRSDTHLEAQTTPSTDTPSVVNTPETSRPDKFRKRKRGDKERGDKN